MVCGVWWAVDGGGGGSGGRWVDWAVVKVEGGGLGLTRVQYAGVVALGRVGRASEWLRPVLLEGATVLSPTCELLCGSAVILSLVLAASFGGRVQPRLRGVG